MERKQSMVERKPSISAFGGWDQGKDLTEEERNATIDRVLRCSNPNMATTPVYFDFKKESKMFRFVTNVDHTATHFAVDGNCIKKDSDEAKKQEEDRRRREQEVERAEEAERNPELVEQGVSTKILKNQFNYSDRASQTINNPMRSRQVVTEPPPWIIISNSASQWEIYDAYEEDRIANERAMAAGKKGKGGQNDDKGKGAKDRAGDISEDVLSSQAYYNALKIMERMVNQNENHEIIADYKYWEDESDQYKDDGNLLPLWKFQSDKVKKKDVTCIAWNSHYNDLFAVGYGSYDFQHQGTGAVQCFTLKNAFPSTTGGLAAFPEFMFQLDSGVMAIDFHPSQPALLACGLYDGSVCVFDLRQKHSEKKLKPIYMSTVRTGKHTDPVWEVRWSAVSSGLKFFSISSDGRVTAWILSKNELQYNDVMQLTMGDTLEKNDDPEAALIGLSGGTCFDFSRENEDLFIVGTEEGLIRRCSKAYNAQYLDTYEGHHMAVYAVKWNNFHPGVFLSCSADWTVKLWEQSSMRPLMSFDLANAVGDVAWAPYSSTVFAAVTADGKVHVFDLNVKKSESLCAQPVVKNTKLNRLAFNPSEPILLVGDGRGTVLSLKLSPNLRQKIKIEKGQPDSPAAIRKLEVEKLDRLIEITLKDRELLDQ